ncbi:hypothetical protein NOF55_21965 [Rhizobiaceae bacterium BDR2-2]|uniref:Uncharacterized protein n=1 Tax=Ectorhizobium quercum TaxID=2965071 RepID=A0AAE3SY40_9HYPH|nr:hypothetical protein [Ectorhizobium quercum]MCX8999774.1 hypothetical protein [Ectorhizobium quercum]
MTLTTLAKISAIYLGLVVTTATLSVLWESGRNLAARQGLFGAFQVADSNAAG